MLCRLIVATGLALAASASWAEDIVWFVVAERPEFAAHGDSFLLPLAEPEAIAKARQLIAEGATPGVLVTGIVAGGDGFNRDVRALDAPAWSWHVPGKGKAGFGTPDVTIEVCQSWPTFVEQDPQALIANTRGALCLVGYTVVEELASPPEFTVNEGLNGAWFNPATPGQGLMLDVIAERGEIFLGWFTYGAGGPTSRPEDEHAWVTAQGTFEGGKATLDAFLTAGGRFDDPMPANTRRIGQIEMEFSDCDHGFLRYAFDDGRTGEFSLERIASRPGCVTRVGDSIARKRPDIFRPELPQP